jgi:F-type H+-transporting ATPase subunit c
MILAEVATQALEIAQANQTGLTAIGKGIAAAGAALGVGFIGLKAAEGVARNPSASTKILIQAIIGMALAEGLGVLGIFILK